MKYRFYYYISIFIPINFDIISVFNTSSLAFLNPWIPGTGNIVCFFECFKQVLILKVEIFLEQREVAFLSPSKICENLNFSREIQIFANFAG